MAEIERTNIGPFVQAIKKQGYSDGMAFPQADSAQYAPTSPVEAAYAVIKPPLHGLYTISTNAIVERARVLGHNSESIRRLKEAIPQVDRPFLLFANGVKGYLHFVIDEHFSDWVQPSFVSSHGSVFQGYDRMLEKMAELGYPMTKEVLVTLVHSGADAGVDYVRAVCEAIPDRIDLEQREADPDGMLHIARRHYPEVRTVAMSTNDLFINLLEDLSQVTDWTMHQRFQEAPHFVADTKFVPEKVHLEETDTGLKLAYDSKIYQMMSDPSTLLPTTPWVGCPAAYGVGVAQIYSWFMEYAPIMYQQMAT